MPVLASDTPALREVGGAAARYLPVDDASAWAAAIDALVADPGARAAAAALGRARAAEFSWARHRAGRGGRVRRGGRVTLAAIDCHMVGQAAAGDAGNGRYAATLLAAMAATAGDG